MALATIHLILPNFSSLSPFAPSTLNACSSSKISLTLLGSTLHASSTASSKSSLSSSPHPSLPTSTMSQISSISSSPISSF
eukprot:CAMPEP_0118633864 /NCGR_PEP_ID=MMETSP0785-20121206/1228_1 /TAXON_ID=91992 /ORGANISM="Bolidomonas pacifica, Strain CCMP 1866" /LENGTH=80 /DNA_ID=CAMNT_0006524775 /DNA_START=56 /DNA_END=295 /DNA_ORIENTATION=-